MTTTADGHDTIPWWRRAVTYQVYVRSFADGNGDGIGDIAGLRQRLPYIADLGVDAVWINPWYPSPLLDGGYDVADYRDIDPRIGTLEEAEALVAEAHELGIRLLADLVPNHTSWEHRWFRAALEAEPGSAERARYVFREGRGADGALPPNDWVSFFGGPAWSRVSDDGPWWYLHLFDRSQPDLNWENEEVRAEFDDILRFWLDRGIDGFRVDVAHSMIKAPGLPDMPRHVDLHSPPPDGSHPYLDQTPLHDIVRRWRAVLDGYDGDRMMVAEAYVHPSRWPMYVRADEYHQCFTFQFLLDGWRGHLHNVNIPRMHAAAVDSGSTPTWVMSNHDQVRHATRFALPETGDQVCKDWLADGPRWWLDEPQGQRRARALALLTLGLPGSAYLYQGEELGLPEAYDLPEAVLQDPEFFRSERKGRDGCRVPMPWVADEPGFGFGSPDPWLPQPAAYGDHAADQQVDVPGSMHSLYRRALTLRNDHGRDDEELRMLHLRRDVVAFDRGSRLRVVVNMGSEPIALPEGELLLASGDEPVGGLLPADDAAWLLR